jgi:hypothetical protein
MDEHPEVLGYQVVRWKPPTEEQIAQCPAHAEVEKLRPGACRTFGTISATCPYFVTCKQTWSPYHRQNCPYSIGSEMNTAAWEIRFPCHICHLEVVEAKRIGEESNRDKR